ncbi:transketolase family protein [Frigoribacterium faeni]|uniref:transketolase n=1 Tax=Frigoribacterium faeni TaxID=145483 RepID=A0A7W3PJW2_9MICO|nr:transketolase [Frigoribacterium faeni]MBA8814920.1 transketolase [Frigoribacterium faeni]GEK82967.1 transketolase [Frigoribacterium faeni]
MANDDPDIRSTDPSRGAAPDSGPDLEARLVAAAVAIPAQVVQAKGHGHAGTAMALAPTAHVLWQHVLRHDPADPEWTGRDRVVLSAGHASLLLYTQLVLTGYDLELDELALSRTLGSRTPGHPELHHTPGVEMSTGPLGQGVASAVGLALAARRDEALHGAGAGLFDPTVWAIAGDGCLQEGVSGEASSLAGTLGLENLVLVWDDNRITIDGGTDLAFSEDVRARYRAYGWSVIDVDDATDLDALRSALEEARRRDGRPALVAVRTVIGAPSVLRGGTPAAHSGGFGADEVSAVKAALGFAPDAGLHDLLPDDVRATGLLARDRGAALHREWDAAEAAWRGARPDLAGRRDALVAGAAGADPAALADALATVAVDDGAATRTTSGAALAAAREVAGLWGGSADLSSSTNVAVVGRAVDRATPGGDFVHFGIREHAMTAMLSGVALHGLWRPYGSTYLAFSDYARPSIRLAALMGLPALYVYTHDSVAVGEDGPTHQPVEQTASLRTVPGLDVVRPADAREVVAVWRRVLATADGPTAFVLSRQALPDLGGGEASEVGTARGGYVLWRSGSGDELALVASGSEVHVALGVARRLADEGVAVRVVSMPCLEWFEQQPADYRAEVLPRGLRARVAIEAGSRQPWYRYAGLDGEVVGIDEFGESGSGPELLHLRGVDAGAVEAAARRVLG